MELSAWTELYIHALVYIHACKLLDGQPFRACDTDTSTCPFSLLFDSGSVFDKL